MDYLQWAIPMALKQGRSKAGDGRPEWWLENCGDSCLFTALPFTCMGMRNRDLKKKKKKDHTFQYVTASKEEEPES